MSGSRSFLPSYGGSKGNKNTQISYLATEGPVVSSFCSENKHLLNISIYSDQCRVLVRDPNRQRILKKLAIPLQTSLKHVNTQVLHLRKEYSRLKLSRKRNPNIFIFYAFPIVNYLYKLCQILCGIRYIHIYRRPPESGEF